jgi:hypothetical protein
LHDDCIQSGKEPILNSALFLESYEEEWRSSRVELPTSSGKGTGYLSNPKPCISTNKCIQWTAPTSEVAKLNSDAAFDADSGQSWGGAIARDHRGHVLVSLQGVAAIYKCGRG